MKGLVLLIAVPGAVLAFLLVVLVLLLLPERKPGKRLAKSPDKPSKGQPAKPPRATPPEKGPAKPGRERKTREERLALKAERERQARARALLKKATPADRETVRRTSAPLRQAEAVNAGFFFCKVEDRYIRTRTLPLWAVFRRCDWEEIARQMVLDDPVLRDAAARLAENRSVYQDYRERMDPITLPAARTVPPDIPAPLYRALEEALFAEAERKPALDSRLVCVVEYRGPGGRGLFRRKREVSLTQAAGLCLTPPNQTSRGAVRGPAPASRV